MPPRVVAVPLPKGVFRTQKKRDGKVIKEYWYYRENRGKPDAGPLIALPDRDDPDFLDAVRQAAYPTAKPAVTIGGMIDEYQASAAFTTKSQNTRDTYAAALAPIRDQWGGLDPAAISVAGVGSLLDQYANRPSMANMIRVMVKTLMKRAVLSGHRPDNPAREVDKLEENPDGAQPIDAPAWAALTGDDAPEAIRRLAILGRATGQRISDLIKMCPKDRDQDGITVRITKLKGKEHWCPLTQAEAKIIDGWGQFGNAPYVLRADGKRYTEDTMRNAWNAFKASKPELGAFTPHDLRATKVCDERIAGKSHQQIAAMVGMSAPMVMKYSRRIDQRLAARGK